MSTTAPPEQGDFTDLHFDLGEHAVRLRVDERIFARDILYGAAYTFLDRCWIFLKLPEDGVVEVVLRGKTDLDTAALRSLAGEFANELLHQQVRHQVGVATAPIRQYYMARAFFGDDRRASIDALLAQLDQEELREDALRIEVPWEKSGG